jgi:hypothetical protein
MVKVATSANGNMTSRRSLLWFASNNAKCVRKVELDLWPENFA